MALNKRASSTNVKSLLKRYPSRPWTSENLSQVLQEILASNIVGDDSDSSVEPLTNESELELLHAHPGFSHSRESKFSGRRSLKKRNSGKGRVGDGDAKHIPSTDFSAPSTSSRKRKISIQHKITDSLMNKGSDVVDLGKISNRVARKLKSHPVEGDLPAKIKPRVNEMIDAIRTAMKYNLQPENFRDEDELEEKIELNSMLKSYRSEVESLGTHEVSREPDPGPFIKGISTFSYKPLQPEKHVKLNLPVCNCKSCKLSRFWVETKRKRADHLVAFLGEPKKRKLSVKVWNCQCEGPSPGFEDENQIVMKMRIPHSMRPDELKKLNVVPRMEIHKHIIPAMDAKVNIKNAVIYKPQPVRPIIQQEMMCHTNEMKCVQLPPPFTGKVTKFETPDWVVEYNKRYVYDYFFQQTKNLTNISFMDFSYKKNLAVLMEEIIQGCMNRTDIFDEDTCQCTFLCTCSHRSVKNPNSTVFDAVRQSRKCCAADLGSNKVYEAGDYVKTGDKTYFVCSKLCNVKMKLHKQLHV